MLTLEFLIHALIGQHVPGSTAITDATIDSREATAGALFVALPGDHSDGHDWVGAAFANGAIAALIDRPVEVDAPVISLCDHCGLPPGAIYPADLDTLPPGPVCLLVPDTLLALQEAARQWYRHWVSLPGRRAIGITGSVGKTTNKEAVAALWSERYDTYRNSGSYNNEIGLPLSVLQIRPEDERAVLEMGFYVRGEIALLCSIAPPELALVTNVQPVHLERAKTVETIIRGKAELLEHLPADGVAILNLDDPNVMKMTAWNKGRVFSYGLTSTADLHADAVEGLGLDGVRLTLHHDGESHKIHTPMLGRHSVYTALAAAAVGLNDGMTWDEITRGLEKPHGQVRLVPGQHRSGALILDDTYNASPGAVIAALDLLADVDADLRVAVLGDMLELGSYEEDGHRAVGAHAAQTADVLITLGERARMIAEEAESNGLPTNHITICESVEEAAAVAQATLTGPRVAALVKGSHAVGMERVVAKLIDGGPHERQ